MDKIQSMQVEEAGMQVPFEGGALSEQHRAYLLQRHGTLDLDPVPSMDPADPYNWPSWKVSSKQLRNCCDSDVLENVQLGVGRFPRLHGHFHSGCDYPGLRSDRRRSWSNHPTGELSHFSPDSHPRWCATALEAAFTPIWSAFDIPLVSGA
jgi:hypothetical protein